MRKVAHTRGKETPRTDLGYTFQRGQYFESPSASFGDNRLTGLGLAGGGGSNFTLPH